MSTLRFEQLNRGRPLSGRDYVRLASLIYDTDPYIYPAVFSSKRQAGRTLPAIFSRGSDEMFCLENCFTGWLADQLVSLILWASGPLEWHDSDLRAELERDVDGISSGYIHAKKEYFSSYRTTPDNVISIINFCVDRRMRNQGIGDAMLRAFIQEHPANHMELFALAGNSAALQVYKKAGFSELRKLDGFSLTAEKPTCIQMFRNAKGE